MKYVIINNLFISAVFLLLSVSAKSNLSDGHVHYNFIKNVGFIENKGQVQDIEGRTINEVLFKVEVNRGEVFLKKNGISYVSTYFKNADSVFEDHVNYVNINRIDVDFLNVNKNILPKAKDQQQFKINYYKDKYSTRMTNMSTYRKILYQNIYDQIDFLFYQSEGGDFKYDIIINPGGNMEDIQIAYSGYKELLLKDNTLEIIYDKGKIEEKIPEAYQYEKGVKKNIDIKFILFGNSISFYAKNYNPTLPLIIDPWVTFLGGDNDDRIFDVKVNQSSEVIVCGSTYSSNLPVTAGAYKTTFDAIGDGFVGKFDAQGDLVWLTFIGGSNTESIKALTIDNNNDIYIAGLTASDDLPVTPGAFQTSYGGKQDALIAKFSDSGSLTWLTYFGGDQSDVANASDIDIETCEENGQTYFFVSSSTRSSNLPTTAGVFQQNKPSTAGTRADLYLGKFNADNMNLVWLTYYGGSKNEGIFGLAIDSNNDVILGGTTTSNDLPISPNAVQTSYAGGSFITITFPVNLGQFMGDGMLVKFNGTMGDTIWATYLGGTQVDWVTDLAVDNENNILLIGTTESVNYPHLLNAYQDTFCGKNNVHPAGDAFINKFDFNGNLIWGTFFGNNGGEQGINIAVDTHNNIYAGIGFYPGNNQGYLPTIGNSFQDTSVNKKDAYLVKYNQNGKLLATTFLAGNRDDELTGLAVKDSLLYAVGYSEGTTSFFPTTAGVFQPATASPISNDGWIAVLPAYWEVPLKADFNFLDSIICFGDSLFIADNSQGEILEWFWDLGNNDTLSNIFSLARFYDSTFVGQKDIKLIVRSRKLCPYFETDTIIKSIYRPTIKLNMPSDTIICKGASIDVDSYNELNGQWIPNTDISCIDCDFIKIQPDDTTQFYLTVDTLGCYFTDSFIVLTKICDYMIPNSFSPDGDGWNDTWQVIGEGIENIHLKIYDPLGKLIFESIDKYISWDGNNNNVPVLPGVYVYHAEVDFSGNNYSQVIVGNITLVR